MTTVVDQRKGLTKKAYRKAARLQLLDFLNDCDFVQKDTNTLQLVARTKRGPDLTCHNFCPYDCEKIISRYLWDRKYPFTLRNHLHRLDCTQPKARHMIEMERKITVEELYAILRCC